VTADCRNCVKETVREFGGVDVVIGNAVSFCPFFLLRYTPFGLYVVG